MSDPEPSNVVPGGDDATSAEATRLASALPIRCIPIEGESLASLGMRLAAANGLRSSRDLITGAGARHLKVTAEAMAKLSGQPLSRILLMSPAWRERPGMSWTDPNSRSAELMGQKLEWHDFRPDRRVCPGCIQDSAHEPLFWQVAGLVGCLKHSTLFVSNCSCGKRLDRSGHVDVCPACGSYLSTLATRSMLPEDEDVTAYVEGRLRVRSPIPVGCLDELSLGQVLALLRWVDEFIWASSPAFIASMKGRDYADRKPYSNGFSAFLGPRRSLVACVSSAFGKLHDFRLEANGTLVFAKVAAHHADPLLKNSSRRLQRYLLKLLPEVAQPIAALIREAAVT